MEVVFAFFWWTVVCLHFFLLAMEANAFFLPVAMIPTPERLYSTSDKALQDSTSFQVKSGIRDLVDDYDVWFLDMWGVMHDGTTTYPGVQETISKLREAGKTLIILSNSSKRRDSSIQMLKKLGFDPSNDFAEIITSGEVAYHLLTGSDDKTHNSLAPQPWSMIDSKSNSNQKLFVFGSGAGDEEYIASCGWTMAPMKEAQLIVARGTFTLCNGSSSHKIDKIIQGEEAYFEAYHKVLQTAAQRKLPMIVANPDKIRPDADRSPMPGTIGVTYQQILKSTGVEPQMVESLVKYIGKPFADVYEIALRGGTPDLSRVCMVGDALETDIAGGSAVGIDTLWIIRDGIHNVDVKSKGEGKDDDLEVGCAAVLEKFNEPENSDVSYAKGRKLMPTYVLPRFQW